MLQGTPIYLIMLPLLNILDTSSFSLLITHPNFFFLTCSVRGFNHVYVL